MPNPYLTKGQHGAPPTDLRWLLVEAMETQMQLWWWKFNIKGLDALTPEIQAIIDEHFALLDSRSTGIIDRLHLAILKRPRDHEGEPIDDYVETLKEQILDGKYDA